MNWVDHDIFFYLMFDGRTYDIFYATYDGKQGWAGKHPNPTEFEPYPCDNYLAPASFNIASIEVFQLQNL